MQLRQMGVLHEKPDQLAFAIEHTSAEGSLPEREKLRGMAHSLAQYQGCR